jgi:ABC-type antimicrobial peptide transport system permease subunit
MRNSFFGASIASGLAVVSLLLASLGVFGVFAYVVEERRREIGVRLALGARRTHIRRSLVAATRWPLIGGLTAGLGLAICGGFLLRSNLFGLSILDPLSYLAAAGILGATAIAAVFVPLRRAWRVDPAVTLRAE